MKRNHFDPMIVQASRLLRMMIHSLGEAPLLQDRGSDRKRLLAHTVHSSTRFPTSVICSQCKSSKIKEILRPRADHLASRLQTMLNRSHLLEQLVYLMPSICSTARLQMRNC